MAPDSVVIVDDVIMPQVGASWKQSSMDLAMMTMLAAMERTKDHFAQLFNESGLELRDVWTYDSDYGDSFIVAVPKKVEAPAAVVETPVVAVTNGVAAAPVANELPAPPTVNGTNNNGVTAVGSAL